METRKVGGGQQTEVGESCQYFLLCLLWTTVPPGSCQDCLMGQGRAGCHVGCQVEEKRSVFPNSLCPVVLELHSNSLGNESLPYCWG